MRVCLISRVRPDRLEEYKARHAAVWPEMLEALRDAGWRNYSLFLTADGLVIGYFETDDHAAAQAAMERTAVNAFWQAEMEQFFVADGRPDRGFAVVEEIFNLEDQLNAHGLPIRPAETPIPADPSEGARP